MSWISADTMEDALQQLTVYLNGADWTTGMAIKDKGSAHWAILLVRMWGFGMGTVMARGLAMFGIEELFFRINKHLVEQQLQRRGTPIGHRAGSGADVHVSKL